MHMFKHILATIDLKDEVSSVRVVKAALEVMDDVNSLHVVCVVPDYGLSVVGTYFPENHETSMIQQATAALHEFTSKHVPAGIRLQHIVAHGNIYEEILEAAKQCKADLIVIGSHRPALKDYLLGPNAARVVRHAQQSVLVVRD